MHASSYALAHTDDVQVSFPILLTGGLLSWLAGRFCKRTSQHKGRRRPRLVDLFSCTARPCTQERSSPSGNMVNARLHATISCQFYQRPQGLQARHQTSRVFEVNRRFHRRTAATAVIKQACRCHLHCARRLPVLEHPKGSVRRLEMHGKTCNNCSDDTCRSKNGLFGCFPHLVLRLVEALAALVLVAQPMPAIAGEIIQGTPRVADGDTLQVLLRSSLLCCGMAQPSLRHCACFAATELECENHFP